MKQVYRRNRLDVTFRYFLLNALDGRSLETEDIIRLIKADFPDKKMSYRRLMAVLTAMARNNLILAEPMEEDRRKRVFTIGKLGKKRKEYYKKFIDGEITE